MKVEVAKVGFSAAHFLIGHERCEHIHGHNWVVGVSVSGEVDEKGMIIDFDILGKILSEVCAKYDHKLLLPGRSPYLALRSNGKSLSLRLGERVYVFPEQDVLILPVENATAEELARLILSEISAKLSEFKNVSEVEVWVEESPGKRAVAVEPLR